MNNSWDNIINELAYAYKPLAVTGEIKQSCEDFFVKEILPFEPEGEGEHAFLLIEKTNLNTEFLARQLAKLAKIPVKDVGYAGLKDRHAVTQQWFSVRLAGKPEPDWHSLAVDGINILTHTYHRKKLKRGALKKNFFRLTIRNITGDKTPLDARLNIIKTQGVPNYFMGQRFGFSGNNLHKAEQLFTGELKKVKRHQRSLYLSAARSYLFNLSMSIRVANGSWNKAIPSDIMTMQGNRSKFEPDQFDEKLQQRLDELDIHITGILWGNSRDIPIPDEIAPYKHWLEGLAKMGMSLDRRALRSVVEDLHWQWLQNDTLELSFHLSPGCYATGVIRELFSDVT